MTAPAPERDSRREASEQRLPALERIFGPHDEYLASPIPFYLGGDPTIVGFRHHLPGIVYCTNEMTGNWGSGQRPGPLGEYEFVMVIPQSSTLGPRRTNEHFVQKGWTGVTLAGMARYSCEAVLKHGETSGPLPPEFAPMSNILFVELGSGRVPFEFGRRRYGLLLCMLINDAEFDFKKNHGADALIKRLRAAKAFPYSDPARPSVC